ncbi:hypothetical protein Tco_1457263, partial [Tanacetum coccineum]
DVIIVKESKHGSKDGHGMALGQGKLGTPPREVIEEVKGVVVSTKVVRIGILLRIVFGFARSIIGSCDPTIRIVILTTLASIIPHQKPEIGPTTKESGSTPSAPRAKSTSVK